MDGHVVVRCNRANRGESIVAGQEVLFADTKKQRRVSGNTLHITGGFRNGPMSRNDQLDTIQRERRFSQHLLKERNGRCSVHDKVCAWNLSTSIRYDNDDSVDTDMIE